jgi:glycosyltransferase involved in cell wall biosynthesis
MDNSRVRLFSVVIPTYNYGHYLSRALDSVLAQSGDDYEIIVVDDGSTDNTKAVVKRYQGSVSQLVYGYQENRGLAATRNLGVRLSKGKYLLFLDADDALLPSALSSFRSAVDHQRTWDFVIAGRVVVSSDGRIKEIHAKPLSSRRDKNFASFLRSKPVTIVNGNSVIHRRVFERLKFPESVRLWEDRVFYAQLLAWYSGTSIDDPVITIYRHASSLSHNVNLVRRDGPKTVDLLFDPAVLPPNLMLFRSEYEGVTHRMLFDALYVSGRYQEAIGEFFEMMRVSPKRALTFQSIRRFLQMRGALMRSSKRDLQE